MQAVIDAANPAHSNAGGDDQGGDDQGGDDLAIDPRLRYAEELDFDTPRVSLRGGSGDGNGRICCAFAG